MNKTKCQTKLEPYILTDYEPAVEFARQQNEVFWLADEIKVDKDVHDIMVNCTEAERHGITEVLRLFTKYELHVGNQYWGNRIVNHFPRPAIQMMANCFSYFEINVHAPFYNKLNEALHINTEEFYMSYLDDEVLTARMKFVHDMVTCDDDLLSLAAFSMLEGVVLYSSFAFLKHFQSRGKNKLLNVVRGINFSVRDENLHCLGGAWLYNTLKDEKLAAGIAIPEENDDVILKAAEMIYEHECYVVDLIFSKGNIEGITPVQLRHFIQSRINICLKQLGIKHMFPTAYNPIAEYFYDGINSYQMNDFFTGIGNQYNRNWTEDSFIWNTNKEDEENDNAA